MHRPRISDEMLRVNLAAAGMDGGALNEPGNAPVLGHPSREAAAPPTQRPDVLLPGLRLHLPQLLVVAAQLQQPAERFDCNLDAHARGLGSVRVQPGCCGFR